MRAKLRDYIVIFICLFILAVSSYYLYLDFNPKRETRDGEKQGFITFKYKVAQRKFPSRMIWEDVEQMLPIYNQDSIRTDSKSEAIVTLNNGIKIELGPDSMFVLNIVGKKVEIEIERGYFLVSTTKPLLDPGNFYLKNKNSEIFFSGSVGEFSVSKDRDILDLVSKKGTTEINFGKSRQSIFERQKANFNSVDDTFTKADLISFEMLPELNTRYFTENQSKEVTFEWNPRIGIDISIEICENPFFNENILVLQTKEKKISKSFPEGIYFWRLRSSLGEISEIRKFRIIKDLPIQLVSPRDTMQFKNETGEILVNFVWGKRELAISYHFEVASDTNFKNVIFERNVFKTNIAMSFGLGEYFWRVKSFDSLKGAKSASKINSFTIEKENNYYASEIQSKPEEEDKPEAIPEKYIPPETNQNISEGPSKQLLPSPTKVNKPSLLFPRANSIVDMNQLDSLHFKWGKVTGAKSYIIKFHQQGISDEILNTDLTANNYNFTQLDKLDVGVFVWTVEAIPELEDGEVSSTTAKFTITLGEQPAAPETISKGKKEEE